MEAAKSVFFPLNTCVKLLLLFHFINSAICKSIMISPAGCQAARLDCRMRVGGELVKRRISTALKCLLRGHKEAGRHLSPAEPWRALGEVMQQQVPRL